MRRILVIEDDDSFRKLLIHYLEVAGYEVVDAPDGDIGTMLYRENPTDLIITDIFMPEKEGIETIIELKRDFPDVKIIAISGSGYRYLGCAEEFGALRTFSKPLDGDRIEKAVNELLEEDYQEVKELWASPC